MKIILLLVIFACIVLGQQTTGHCSPVTNGNNNAITINCSGVTKEQGEKLLTLLNDLVSKQIDIDRVVVEINSKLPQYRGVLLPANEVYKSTCVKLPSRFELILGNNQMVTGRGGTGIQVGSDYIFLRPSGQGISVDAEIHSVDGKLTARIQKNEFTVGPYNTFAIKTPDASTLFVEDAYGERAIYVRLLNSSTARIMGTFHPAPGVRVAITEQGIDVLGTNANRRRSVIVSNSCLPFNGGMISIDEDGLVTLGTQIPPAVR